MRYKALKEFKDKQSRQLTGVKWSAFEEMVDILKEAEVKKKATGGKPNSLGMESRLCMILEYIREYRTYFHVAWSLWDIRKLLL